MLSMASFYTAQEHSHTEDILCVAFDASHLMATASFDGEVCYCTHTLPSFSVVSQQNLKLLYWKSQLRMGI